MKQILKLCFLMNILLIMYINCAQLKRKRLLQLGDLMVGALIPVHEQPNDSDQRKCGTIRDQYGVQRVEALLYLLDKINNKTRINILPGIKLGLEIRDECWDSGVALEETIDFIKDTISSSSIDTPENEAFSYATTTGTKFQNESYSVSLIETINNNESNNCMNQAIAKSMNGAETPNAKILAVVGPSGSTVAITVQNLLQLFDIPQVGFSATSADLSNKKMYKTFLRVVPSDYLQVRAMVDIVLKMNWTYIFAVYTDGSYGQAGMEAFRNETVYLNICLAEYEKIQEYASKNDYEVLIRKLNKTEKARVIVCFCYGETVRGLLGAINRLNLKGRFLILGSDGWSDRIDVAKGYYEEAYGSLSVKAYSPLVKEFDDYFIRLNPSNNLRNVWFEEYWQERFKCYLNDDYKKKFPKPCKSNCPANFELIGSNCYYFSTERQNWKNAFNECKARHYDAELIDLNDKQKLEEILDYLYNKSDAKKLMHGLHGQLEKPFLNLQFRTRNNKMQINLYPCNSKPDTRQSIINKNSNQNNTSGIECSYLEIDNITLIRANNINYCLNINDCKKEFYFICVYDLNKKAIKNTNKGLNYEDKNDMLVYTDTLQNYQQDPKMSYVMNAFLAVAYGLNNVHTKVCKNVSGVCDEMKKVNGSTLLKYIREAKFEGITKEKIYFYPNGDPPGRYVILNVQRDKNSPEGFVYKEVGNWDNENQIKLNLSVSDLVFPEFESQCSKPCLVGYVKQLKQGGQKCCWNCKKCEEHAYAIDEFLCQECAYGYWPAPNASSCIKLPLEYLKWSEPASLFALLISFIGIIVNTFVTHIFIKFSNTCVVKSTTKELSFIILAGAYLCYLVTIPLVLKPGAVTCYLARILPGLSLSLVYGALITKTNRISRILSRSKKRILTRKPRFMSIYAQIVITVIIITAECAIIVVTFIMDPTVSIVTYPQRNKPRLQCFYSVYTILGPIGYDLLLVGLCTLYAIRTRNLPENFNEAKFIGFSMYTTCVIWIAFIPLYFGSDFKVITLCLSTSLSATVILIFLFFPKVYIIIFKPERNQRSAFATSKDLRCHFGSSNPVRDSASASASISDYEKSFVSSRKSYGMSMLEKIGIKNSLTVSVKSDSNSSTNGTKITVMNNAKEPNVYNNYNASGRSLAKPKNGNQDRSLDSLITRSSTGQTYDRSCQTSQELLLPMIDKEIRRRKAYGVDENDDLNVILNQINDRYEEKPAAIDDKNKKGLIRSFSVLGRFQNYLIPAFDEIQMEALNLHDIKLPERPITENNNNSNINNENNFSIRSNIEIKEPKESSVEKESTPESNNEDDSNEFSFRNKRNKFLSRSFKSIQSRCSKLGDNKGLFKLNSLKRKMAKPETSVSDTDKSDTSSEKNEAENNESSFDNLNSRSPNKRSQLIVETQLPTAVVLPKITEAVEDQNSTSSIMSNEDLDIDTNICEEITKQIPSIEYDSSISSSLSNINSNEYYNYDKKDRNFKEIIEETFNPSSDIENEFMVTLDKEDESLEKFKKILTRDNNIVLSWDYVQSSDYL